MDYILVGKIINTHGIKGEVKIESNTDFDRFNKGNVLYIYFNNEYIKVTIKSHRIHKEKDLVTFVGYEDINLVEKYKGSNLYIENNLDDELEDDEYYYREIIGLKCYNTSNKYLGICVGLREVPQGIIIEIEKENGKIALVPFVKEFIVDVLKDSMIIKEIEGLI